MTIGSIAAICSSGLLTGGIAFGIIADKFGRMYSFKISVVIAAIASIGLTLSQNYQMVAGCLFAIGFSMSGELSLGCTVFLEFCPPSKRYYLTMMSLFSSLGAVTISMVALIVAYTNTSSIHDWRYIVAFGCLCELLSVIFRCFIIETPAYYISKGDNERAEKILNIISMRNTGKEFLLSDPKLLNSGIYEYDKSSINIENNESHLAKTPTTLLIKQICKEKFIKLAALYSIVTFMQIYFTITIAYFGFIYFMPEFLSNFSKTESYGIIFIQELCGAPGVIAGTYLVETRLGRRFTTSATFFLSGIACLPFYFNQSPWTVIST